MLSVSIFDEIIVLGNPAPLFGDETSPKKQVNRRNEEKNISHQKPYQDAYHVQINQKK